MNVQDVVSRRWACWNLEYRRVTGPGWKDFNSTLQAPCHAAEGKALPRRLGTPTEMDEKHGSSLCFPYFSCSVCEGLLQTCIWRFPEIWGQQGMRLSD